MAYKSSFLLVFDTEMENVTDAEDTICVKYLKWGKFLSWTYGIFGAKRGYLAYDYSDLEQGYPGIR